jgi:ribosomal-protein-alanine N-acetyltransferase
MRIMTAADVDEVLAIEHAVQAYPWTRGNFCDALDSSYLCYVEETSDCVDKASVRGYAVLMPGVDEAELLNIGVAAAHQRQGVGGMMLSMMLDVAGNRGLSRVLLEVRASNRAAIALYRRAGFIDVSVRRGYYRNAGGSEDAVVMACDIPSPLAILPQVGKGNMGVEGINSASLPQAGERLGERGDG